MKTAVTFTPVRQWKRRRRNRNMQQRMLRKRWYQRNKSKLRTQRRQRYKQLRKNPTWKRWQKKLRREKNKRRLVASEVPRVFAIPVGDRVWWGLLRGLDPGQDQVSAISLKSGASVLIPLEIFLRFACFTNRIHELEFWMVLEAIYGETSA